MPPFSVPLQTLVAYLRPLGACIHAHGRDAEYRYGKTASEAGPVGALLI